MIILTQKSNTVFKTLHTNNYVKTKTQTMKKISIIFLSLIAAISAKAQDNLWYPVYGNIAQVTIDEEEGVMTASLYPAAKLAYQALVGSWQAQEDPKLSFTLLFSEAMKDGIGTIRDCAEARDISHPDFEISYRLSLGGTRHDDINNLSKIYFSFIPQEFTSEQIYVSGYAYVADSNTLRFEILGVEHPLTVDDELAILPDYTIDSAPAEVLVRVPAVLRQKVLTFKRQ